MPPILLAVLGCTEHILYLEGGPCPGAVEDDRFDLDATFAGTTARDAATDASGTRFAELVRDEVGLGDDVFHWTFEARRADLYDLTGGDHWYDRDAICPVGPALKVQVRVELTSDEGFQGDGEGFLWFADDRTWVSVNGELSSWPVTATTLGQPTPICQGAPTTQVRFGTSAMLGQLDVDWQGAPQGTFSNERRPHCRQVDFGWIDPEEP